jgi:hypothetical protein
MCRNVRSIEWHQKTYHEISWDYPFNLDLISGNPVCLSTAEAEVSAATSYATRDPIKNWYLSCTFNTV